MAKKISRLEDLTPDSNNFNRHTEFGNKLLEDSLRKFGAGRSILTDKDGNIIAGNGVTEVAAAIGMEDVEVVHTDGKKLVVVVRDDLELDSPEGRELALADNMTALKGIDLDLDKVTEALKGIDLDLDKVTEALGEDIAKAWGMELPKVEKTKPDKRDDVEEMLNDAMRDNVVEYLEQVNMMLSHPKRWILQGITEGMCKAKFIRAKYYGEEIPQYITIYFCPERFMTSANSTSIYDTLVSIESGKSAGIAGCRTLSNDGSLNNLFFKGGYPIGGGRMPLDFPSAVARDIYSKFSQPPRVLDPCHGWGGRLIGAMLADVKSYTGCDPSEEASRGVHKIAQTFSQYAKNTEVELFCQPFEDVNLGDRKFDVALTSPPYFDVEQYHGQSQAHVRYPKYNLWRDGFYRILIEKTYTHLTDGGMFYLQVGSKSYPLLTDGCEIAKDIGFSVQDIIPFGRGTSSSLHSNTDDDPDNEKIIILKKSTDN